MADATSIEATNKVRASLGLPLLPVPGGAGDTTNDTESSGSEEEEEDEKGSTLESRQAEGYNNWNQLQKLAEEKNKRQAKLDAIKKARDEAQRLSKLSGKGLGEEDEDEDLSAKAWLQGAKKRLKKIDKKREKAVKLEKELREREEREYTSKDLAGVKVAHQVGDFDTEGDGQVLTLKDATIEENEEEGDELENIYLAEQERRDERLNLKRKKPGYNPNDVDENDEKTILKQYDEVIDGKKRKHFLLDTEGQVAEREDVDMDSTGERIKPKAINLDILKELPTSDYQEPSEVKIKKPKKKKAKSIRQKQFDDDIVLPSNNNEPNGDSMDIDSGPAKPSRRSKDVSFVDDEDLQASLAKQRREALKQRKKMKPEDLATQIREEAPVASEEEKELEAGGLVIDETTEFVANLQLPEPEKPRQFSDKSKEIRRSEPPESDEDEDVDMGKSYNEIDNIEIKREESEPAAEVNETGLGEEKTVASGVAAALSLARDRGLVKSEKEGESNEQTRMRAQFMAEKAKLEKEVDDWVKRQREILRASGEWDRLSIREREHRAQKLNEDRDRRKADLLNQLMNQGYKPTVNISYVDEHGRHMAQKEAFKFMSHTFHGKGSGKQKTEKHIKKIQEEKQREAKSALDSGATTGMNNAQSATARKNRQPGVRLA
jgi:U4/U6.U5 tri-snRNP-associated protein 1